jgi:SAM-dependent methyltransferase
VILLAVLALFVSAFLLFWGELLAGKLLLPVLGGAPQVFVTSLLVFQALLLAGYATAAVLVRGQPTRRRFVWQAGLLIAALVVGPPLLPDFVIENSDANPIGLVIIGVLATVGAPFFALSVHAPLLQRWLSLTTSRHAENPYFLYVASNAGSFAGLIAFPLVLEPALALDAQAPLYFALTGVAALLVVGLLFSTPLATASVPTSQTLDANEKVRDRKVVALGALPALHLGATTLALSLDLAAIPLLWVMPLAAYLLSFVVAFSAVGARATVVASRALPFALIAITFIHVTRSTEPALLILLLHLSVFFIGALVCHGHVAMLRPDPRRLTRFYLLLSFGGAVGGALAAVVAPMLFTSLLEIPLSLALLPLAVPGLTSRAGAASSNVSSARRADVVTALGIGLIGVMAVFASQTLGVTGALGRLFIGVPIGLLVVTKERPLRLSLSLVVVFAVGAIMPAPEGDVVRAERSFFGVHRIIHSDGQKMLYQGTTEHGSQSLDAARREIPGAYYHPRGPGGEVLARMIEAGRLVDAAFIGLGSGALAAYAVDGSRFTFIEIDPVVARLADEEFTFMRDARLRGATVDVVIGDGRQKLAGSFDLVVMDAFTSGAVPVHLLTVEALAKAKNALRPRGVLLMHISNRHLDLEAVTSRVAREVGLVARTRTDFAAEPDAARAPSQWAALAASEDDLRFLSGAWHELEGGDAAPLFTDQRSNLVEVIRW